MFFTGWSLTRRLGPQWQTYIEAQQKQIAALEKELKESDYPYVHGMSDKATDRRCETQYSRQPARDGRDLAARISRRPQSSQASRPTLMEVADWSLLLTSRKIRSPRASSSIAIWKWHFGIGIVNTPDNFGVMGDKPSNPELLEFLAKEFVDHKQSIKWLQRPDHAFRRLPDQRGRVSGRS